MLSNLLDFGGRLMDSIFAGDRASGQRSYDKEMADTFIQRRVADAKKAGVSPLFALGAGGYTPGVVSVGTDFAGMGQGLGRAIDAMATGSERNARRLEELAVERGELENAKLRADIALSSQSQVGPSYPDAGTKRVPVDVTTSLKGRPGVEPGAGPSVSFIQRPDGGVGVVYGQGIKQKIEDSPYEWTEFARNILATGSGSEAYKPPKSWLPKGAKDWRFNIALQGWYPYFTKERDVDFVGPPRRRPGDF